MSKCPYCEQLSPAASKFCSECGAALHLQPCAQCGALNDIGKTAQCGRCEAPLWPPGLASEATEEDGPAAAPLPGADDRHSQHEPPLALALPMGLDFGLGATARDGQTPGRRLLPALGLLLLGLMAMGAFYGSRPLQAQTEAAPLQAKPQLQPQASAAAPSPAQVRAQAPAEVQTPAPAPVTAKNSPVSASPAPAEAAMETPMEMAPRSRRVRASENRPQAPSAPSPSLPNPARPASPPPCSEAMAALNLCENPPSAATPRKP